MQSMTLRHGCTLAGDKTGSCQGMSTIGQSATDIETIFFSAGVWFKIFYLILILLSLGFPDNDTTKQ